MLTTLSLYVDYPVIEEVIGSSFVTGEVLRCCGDTSQPLTLTLTSSDESEVVVPNSVTIPANETTAAFPVDIIDDTLLDGDQLVTLTADDGNGLTQDTQMLILDWETATLTVDQSAATPGDTITGTMSTSVTGNTDPISVLVESSRPDEIASFTVEVPAGQQSASFSVPVTLDATQEGRHSVQLNVDYDGPLYGNSDTVVVSDPGVTTISAVADGYARDADQDGIDFEELTLTASSVLTQAASSSGSFGESRSIVEFDVSSIPAGVVVESAVLTVRVNGGSGTDVLDVDMYAYQGDGQVASADALETSTGIGTLSAEPGIEGLHSYPVTLDTSIVQGLIDGGDYIGIAAKLNDAFANTGRSSRFLSSEHFYDYDRPSLHLVYAPATSLTLSVDQPTLTESAGVGATFGTVVRDGGDTTQPLTITLGSSDPTEVVVPASVTIPANELEVSFPVDIIDDTLLDGDQSVTLTATAGAVTADTAMSVEDYETIAFFIPNPTASPGGSVTGQAFLSVRDNPDPITIVFTSSSPDEIAETTMVLPAGGFIANFSIPVTSDAVPLGPHTVRLAANYESPLGEASSTITVLGDPDVTTVQPVANGHATDQNGDGVDFEQVTLNPSTISNKAAWTTGVPGETRGILEFDLSSVPENAVVQSALLTVQVNSTILFNTTSEATPELGLDVFAYQGDGVVGSADAAKTAASVGSWIASTGSEGHRGYVIPLNTSTVQSLINSGDYLGLVTRISDTFANSGHGMGYRSNTYSQTSYRPALHLTFGANATPVLVENSLAIAEGATAILTANDLAASDPDTADASLTFATSNVSGGQFLLGGSPATTFSQADIIAGQVAFAHDDSEYAPSYEVTVSDEVSSVGPAVASINFTNVNDNAPMIAAGQSYSVSEAAVQGSQVGIVSADDGDLPGDSLAFNIVGGNTDGVFAIDNAGKVTIADAGLLDFETAQSHTLTIEVFDGTFTSSEDIVVDVLDVAEVESVTLVPTIAENESAQLYGQVTRNGDLSQPMTVNITSSDVTELVVGSTIVIPANESSATFPFLAIDDTLLDGDVPVTVTATGGSGVATGLITVQDVETVSFSINALASPILAVYTVSNTDRDEPLTIFTESTRPDEISLPPVTIPIGQQSASVPLTIQADSVPESWHSGRLDILPPPGYFSGDQRYVTLVDQGVTGFWPAADGDLTDTDGDGVFEDVRLDLLDIRTRLGVTGGANQSRGILEYAVDSISPDAFIQSAVLTLDVSSISDPGMIDVAVYAYAGDGQIESADAIETGTLVGQFTPDYGTTGIASYPIILDTVAIQSIVDSSDYVGFVTIISSTDGGDLTYHSFEDLGDATQPVMSLVLAYPPEITTNSLTISEGATVTLTSGDLTATDVDSDDAALMFSVGNIQGGQFLVSGVAASTFTQAQVGAGEVSFVHDNSEGAPSYEVTVSDGTFSDGPQAAAISFSNVNDNAPNIPAGQAFTVSENAGNGVLFGTVLFSDSDLPGDTLSATISAGNADGIFDIDSLGNVSIADNANLDFETATSHTLSVSIFDGANTSVQDITVDVLDVNDNSPVLTANTLAINEGGSATLTDAELDATDVDSTSLTYSVSNVVSGEFRVSGVPVTSFTQAQVGAGEVSFVHDGSESAPSYDITVSDGTFSDGPQAAAISFTNVNDNAPNIPAGQTFTMSEDAGNGASLGTVLFSDIDLPGDTLSATISAGNADGIFDIDSLGNLSIADNANLDFETATSHTLSVSIFDGVNTSVQDITVDVLDVNDNPPVLTANTLAINEGGSATLTDAELDATDVDSTSLTYSVSNVVRGEFRASGVPVTVFTQAQVGAGEVSFVHDGSEDGPSYDITVSDGTFSDGPQAAAISFTNVNDNAPNIPAGQAFTVSEHADNGVLLGTVLFSDSDLPGDALSTSIPAGNADGIFAIDNLGNLSIADNANLDFETASSHTLSIEVFDGINSSTQDVTVNVLDVPEGPVTKFFVVDVSSDDMFEYEADGTPVINYNLGSGNSSPRGATSNAAGDTVWVVDNEKWVYVYDADGNMTGSWKTSGLSKVEGIATDGTNIWIVDRGNNRVYRFDGAALFASGTHAADSSFALNSANKAARGITSDGTHIWVLNGRKNSTDHVFKYTVSGAYLGKWQLDIPGGRPEGITVDSTDPEILWIVDKTTDKVYRYTGGTEWTSGTRPADATFDLATGNSNPRGIADPPPRVNASISSKTANAVAAARVAARNRIAGDGISDGAVEIARKLAIDAVFAGPDLS